MILKHETLYFQFTKCIHFSDYVQSLLWDAERFFSITENRVRTMLKGKDEDCIISVSKDCDIVLNIYLSELTLDWHNLQTDLRNQFSPQLGVIIFFLMEE